MSTSDQVVPADPKGKLNSDAGQSWREYDLRPFAKQLSNDVHADEIAVEWILRETGTDVWFRPPIGLLNVTRDKVLVFHTDRIQSSVQSIVERITSPAANRNVVNIRLISVDHPDWRTRSWPWLKRVPVPATGLEVWLLERERAAMLLSDLRRRPDFREIGTSQTQVQNGQTQTIEQSWPARYTSGIEVDNGSWPGYRPRNDEIDERYSIRVSPLFSVDATQVDTVVRLQVNRVERMTPYSSEVPMGNTTQRVSAEVPEITAWHLHERLRWPTDQVLLVSRGMVSLPDGRRKKPAAIQGLLGGTARIELLLFLECQELERQPNVEIRSGERALHSRGRY
jgi:hypothetical protein